ncbi:MAG: hypothetical protein AB4352_02235 [Hormoscilla sp.]
MTRFLYDQFFKDCLDGFLNQYGEVQIDKRVTSEVRQIDVWFVPNPEKSKHRSTLGLLGRMAATRAIFEPFHSAATVDEICDCMVKLRDVCSQEKREASRSGSGRSGRRVKREELPRLWVLTPTASKRLLSEFKATIDESWMDGVYFLGKVFRTAIVVIHKLPNTPETLWLRLLGKGKIQSQAIEQLNALPPEHPLREMTLELLLNFHEHLSERKDLDAGGNQLVMQLEPLWKTKLEKTFQEGEQRGILEGIVQGEQRLRRAMFQNLLQVRFGDLDAELASVLEQMSVWSLEDSSRLIMELPQLSREELLARFPKSSQ